MQHHQRRTSEKERSGIVLLMTLFFVMAITVVVGVSLSNLQAGNAKVQEARFLAQSAITTEDTIAMFSGMETLLDGNSTLGFNIFLQTVAAIPLNNGDYEGLVSIESARGRLNINTLAGSPEFQQALLRYLQIHEVEDPQYVVTLLLDCMGGTRAFYNSDIFERAPWLFRDRIVDGKHLHKILEHYVFNRNDAAVYNVPWEKLFRYDLNTSNELDANYVSDELWTMMLAETPVEHPPAFPEGVDLYENAEDLELDPEIVTRLTEGFHLGFYSPTIQVHLQLRNASEEAEITFEYDILKKQAKEFKYVI